MAPPRISIKAAAGMGAGMASPGEQPTSREDHRITVKIMEAKNLTASGVTLGDKDETYCFIIEKKGDDSTASAAPPSGNSSGPTTLNRPSAAAGTNLKKASIAENADTADFSAPNSPINAANTERTKTVGGKTPFWGEEFEFELDDQTTSINVQVYKKNALIKDAFVGQVTIPIDALELDNKLHEEWYSLLSASNSAADEDSGATKAVPVSHKFDANTPSSPVLCGVCKGIMWGKGAGAMMCNVCGFQCHDKCCSKVPTNCGSVGALRVGYLYTREPILPASIYGAIKDFVLDQDQTLLGVFAKVCDEREDAARHIINICECANYTMDYLSTICGKEITGTKDPNTIFRGNSLSSKSLDVYMKMVGKDYMKKVLQPIVKEILKQNRDCELDPLKMDESIRNNSEVKEEHETVLVAYIEWALREICNSSKHCPPGMRQVFSHLQKEAVRCFPQDPVIRYTVVSGFIFLRFFNAAILGPKLFGLTDELPSARNARTFTLISKAVQQAANIVEFDGKKEPYMTVVNTCIKRNFPNIKRFIDEVATEPKHKHHSHHNKGNGDNSGRRAGCFSCFFPNSRIADDDLPHHDDKHDPKPTPTTATQPNPNNKNHAHAHAHHHSSRPLISPPGANIDVERHLAALTRHISRSIEKMLPASPEETKPRIHELSRAIKELETMANHDERQRLREEQVMRLIIAALDSGWKNGAPAGMKESKTVPSLSRHGTGSGGGGDGGAGGVGGGGHGKKEGGQHPVKKEETIKEVADDGEERQTYTNPLHGKRTQSVSSTGAGGLGVPSLHSKAASTKSAIGAGGAAPVVAVVEGVAPSAAVTVNGSQSNLAENAPKGV